mmetsp:Transcript_50421/g.134001  ORF Transcript_50421/g.134001 Transcript_50421/m.134001 type:complete len:272 (-) Transcript_50421:799-1614(-)
MCNNSASIIGKSKARLLCCKQSCFRKPSSKRCLLMGAIICGSSPFSRRPHKVSRSSALGCWKTIVFQARSFQSPSAPAGMSIPPQSTPGPNQVLKFCCFHNVATTSSKYRLLTGKTRPGTSSLRAPSKYCSKVSNWSVALIRISFKSGRCASKSLMKIMLKSASLSRSCTSSNTTCVMPARVGSLSNRFLKTPKVQNTSRAFGALPPKGTWYPTSTPTAWHLSSDTRCARVTAANFRGCITRTLAPGHASMMVCGTCVDFPQPVSPLSSTT